MPFDQSAIRSLNRRLVVDALKRRGPASRAELAKLTELTKPTVSAIVDELITDGVAIERGAGQAGAKGGRRPVLVEFNDRFQYFVGVELGEHETHVALAGAAGEEVARRDLATPRDPDDAVAAIHTALRETLAEVDAPMRRVGGMAVVVAGLVEEATGTCLLAPNLGWRNVALGKALSRPLGSPVIVRNHAQAFGLAEALEGAGRDHDVVVTLVASTGVGAAVTVGGQLYDGGTGVSAEIGHCRVTGGRAKCSCGLTGCLETVAALPAVAREAGLRASKAAAEALARKVSGGDKKAVAAVRAAADELGIAASWLVNLFGPQSLVVAGEVFELDGVLPVFRQSLASHSLRPVIDALDVSRAELGPRAGLRGAVLVAMGAGASVAGAVRH